MAVEMQKDPYALVIPDVLPVLPLRDTVLFPFEVTPLMVAQERSIRLVDDVMRANRLLALAAQRNVEARPAGPNDLHSIGIAAVIHQMLRTPEGAVRLVVQGLERIRVLP